MIIPRGPGLVPGGFARSRPASLGNRENHSALCLPQDRFFRLQVNARDRIVLKVLDNVRVGLRENSRASQYYAAAENGTAQRNSIGAYRLPRAFVHENNSRRFFRPGRSLTTGTPS